MLSSAVVYLRSQLHHLIGLESCQVSVSVSVSQSHISHVIHMYHWHGIYLMGFKKTKYNTRLMNEYLRLSVRLLIRHVQWLRLVYVWSDFVRYSVCLSILETLSISMLTVISVCHI